MHSEPRSGSVATIVASPSRTTADPRPSGNCASTAAPVTGAMSLTLPPGYGSAGGVRTHDRTGAVPRRRARVRRRRDRTARRSMGPRPRVPRRHRARDGQARPVRPAVPRGVRRRRRRLPHVLPRDRGDRARRLVDGDHARSRREPRRRAVLLLRHRGAEGRVPRADDRRRGARCVRAHRSRGGLGRRCDPHAGARSTMPRTSG